MEGGAANAGSFEEFITRFLRPATLSAEECQGVGSVRRPPRLPRPGASSVAPQPGQQGVPDDLVGSFHRAEEPREEQLRVNRKYYFTILYF